MSSWFTAAVLHLPSGMIQLYSIILVFHGLPRHRMHSSPLLSGLGIMTSLKEQRQPEEMWRDSKDKEEQRIYSATQTSCFLSSDLGFFFWSNLIVAYSSHQCRHCHDCHLLIGWSLYFQFNPLRWKCNAVIFGISWCFSLSHCIIYIYIYIFFFFSEFHPLSPCVIVWLDGFLQSCFLCLQRKSQPGLFFHTSRGYFLPSLLWQLSVFTLGTKSRSFCQVLTEEAETSVNAETGKLCDQCHITVAFVWGLIEQDFFVIISSIFWERDIVLLTSGQWILVSNKDHFHISHVSVFLGMNKKSHVGT